MPVPIQPDDPSYGALPGENKPVESPPSPPAANDHLIIFTSPEMEFANAEEFYNIIDELVSRAPGILDQQRVLADIEQSLPLYKNYFEANNQDPSAFAANLKTFIDQQLQTNESFSLSAALSDWKLFSLKDKFEQLGEYFAEPPLQPAATWEDFFKTLGQKQRLSLTPDVEFVKKFLEDVQGYEKYYNKNSPDAEGFKAKFQEFVQQSIQEKGYFSPSESLFSWKSSVLNDQAGTIQGTLDIVKTDEEKLATVSAYARMTKAMLNLFRKMEDSVIAMTELIRVKTDLLEIVSEKKSAIGLFTQNDAHPLGEDDEDMAAMRDSLNNLGNLARNDWTTVEGSIRGVIDELTKLEEALLSAKNSWTEDYTASLRSTAQITSKVSRING
jgi:hypothetical protein